mgnify:CR=1 FL=1
MIMTLGGYLIVTPVKTEVQSTWILDQVQNDEY